MPKTSTITGRRCPFFLSRLPVSHGYAPDQQLQLLRDGFVPVLIPTPNDIMSAAEYTLEQATAIFSGVKNKADYYTGK